MTLLFIIVAIVMVAWLAWNYLKAEDLAEKEDYLNKYSDRLDERANRLAKWEDELISWSQKNDENRK